MGSFNYDITLKCARHIGRSAVEVYYKCKSRSLETLWDRKKGILSDIETGHRTLCLHNMNIENSYTGRQVLERDSNWNGVHNTDLHSRLIGPWRPYDCEVTHTWGNWTVLIAVAAVFGRFLTFIWFCYLIYATITSNNDGDRRKIAIPFMTNYACNCIVS